MYTISGENSKKQIQPGVFLLLLTVLCSCIYTPSEELTYVNPASAPPNLTLRSLEMDADSIYIWSPDRFSFTLSSDGASVWAVKIECLGQTFRFDSPNGYFDIDPTNFADGVYTIKMEVYTHTGTGSLADHLGAEAYAFTKEWILIIERPNAAGIKFTHTSTENGFLTIHWNKFDRPYFHAYKIEVSDSALHHFFSRTITDVNTTSICDSSFVGGKVEFKLKLSYYYGDGMLGESQVDNYTYRFPVSLSFEEDLDSLTIRWIHIPFQHNVYVNYSLIPGHDSVCRLRSTGLGDLQSYQIAIDPVVDLTFDHQRYYIYHNHTMGNKTAVTFGRMSYDPETDAIYVKHPMYFRKFDGTAHTLLGSYDYSWDYYDNATIALSPDKSRVFTTVLQDLVQFTVSPFAFASRERLPTSENGDKTYSLMKILNDSLLYLTYNARLAIFNFKTGAVVDYIDLSGSDGAPYHITISKDNRYVANCGQGTLKVYRNTDNKTLDLIYETSGNFLECIFDPLITENLLAVTLEDNFILRCTDMQVIFDFPDNVKGMAVNFDPVTNYLLFVSAVYKTIMVYDYQNDIIKFKCNHHGIYRDFYLANNTVFHGSGYNLNISAYAK